MLPDDATEEFANTFKEWHYFVGGAAVSAVAFAVGLWALAWRAQEDND